MLRKNLFDLSGKVSLVTGAGSGLGRVFCQAMAEYGSDVVCTDIDESWAKETESIIAQNGVKTLAVRADVSNPEDVRALFGRVDKEFRRLDILFNNAGITSKDAKTHEMPLADWDRVIAVNLTGVFLCIQEGIKLMLHRKKGTIINISSISGHVGVDPDIIAGSNYAAAKAGVVGLTKQVAVEYASDGIRVNTILPGWHAGTRLGSPKGRTEEQVQVFVRKLTDRTPMRRRGEAEELKGLAVYLASDASSFVTGSTFIHDGGWCAA